MLRSEEISDCTAKHALNGRSVAETLRETLTSLMVPHKYQYLLRHQLQSPSREHRVLGEMSTQDPAIPIAPIPPTPTTPTRKRTTRLSIFPVILPEDFPVSALIRRAHIRRRKRVQAARIRPLPPLPCATAATLSRKPSQGSTLSIAQEEGKVRPLPAVPCTIPEGSSEGD
jgi:hypothetical protein